MSTYEQLTELENVAKVSLNCETLRNNFTKMFYIELDEEEVPLRFYQAAHQGKEGYLLLTDLSLTFIDENNIGLRIKNDEIMRMEMRFLGDKNFCILTVDSELEMAEFFMKSFGIKHLMEQAVL